MCVCVCVLVLEGLVGLHRTIQLQCLQHYTLGIDLDYWDAEWFALETNCDHSVVFEIAPKYYISDLFVDYEGYSIPSKGFSPTIVDIEKIKMMQHGETWASQVALVVKNLPPNAGDARDSSLIAGSGRLLWRKAWQHTPIFLLGESYGQRSLVVYRL